MNYIAFDAHKRYTLASVERAKGGILGEVRVGHERGAIRQFLLTCDPGSPVAVETIGNWYWIVDEIEEAGMVPRLVHARKAKLMMGSINKTDKLDARGLNLLQRNGALPTVWIPPAGQEKTPDPFSPQHARTCRHDLGCRWGRPFRSIQSCGGSVRSFVGDLRLA